MWILRPGLVLGPIGVELWPEAGLSDIGFDSLLNVEHLPVHKEIFQLTALTSPLPSTIYCYPSAPSSKLFLQSVVCAADSSGMPVNITYNLLSTELVSAFNNIPYRMVLASHNQREQHAP